MKICFRVDSSTAIGTGHVMRCLTIASVLRGCGCECSFVCRLHQGHLIELIHFHGHAVIALDECDLFSPFASEPPHAAWLGADWRSDAMETVSALGVVVFDWLIVDHYALDFRWEKILRPYCKHLMVIDDLADRVHDCDLLLDQNLCHSPEDYRVLVPENATKLVGSKFAILRPEFAQSRQASLMRRARPELKHLLISMGGVDSDNVTEQILAELETWDLQECVKITVVMGPKAPWLYQVKARALTMGQSVKVLVGIDDMDKLMSESDLAIGAAGGTAWERCCLGLPSLLFVLAENQRAGAAALESIGAAVIVDHPANVKTILDGLLMSKNGLQRLANWSAAASRQTDGKGVFRVCKRLLEFHD